MTACPVCAGTAPVDVLTLEPIPVLCNSLYANEASARCAPMAALVLVICEVCGHLYNRAFEPELVNYDGTYDTTLHHSARFQSYVDRLATRLVKSLGLAGGRVLEMGCGQGDFLIRLIAAGAGEGIGFDPSYRGNPQPAPGLVIHAEPFRPADAAVRADLACSRHVLEHLEAPSLGLRLLADSLAPTGKRVIYCEVPNALYTLEQGGVWDLIYEHVSYFTPASMQRLAELEGLDIISVEPGFGGQYLGLEARVPAGRQPSASAPADTAELMARAAALGQEVSALRSEWAGRLDRWRQEGRTAALWGAGSKGATFLNIVEDADRIALVVDISPTKIGRHIPGTGQMIVSPETLAAKLRGPAEIICMNPVYRDEIAATLADLGVEANLHLA